MADQSTIDVVKTNLPSWLPDITDWTDQKIGTLLDQFGNNVNKVVRQFWLDRVNATAGLTDVADAGVSRPLSQVYQHAKEMLAYWDRLAGTGGQNSSVGKIKQRYPKRVGHGLNPFGGVYVRTD